MAEKINDEKEFFDSIVSQLSQGWESREKPLTMPVMLLIGGHQGSGKTTVIDHIKDELELVVVSPDEIRQKLFDNKFPFSQKFIDLVNMCRDELIRRALGFGLSLAVDTNATPARIDYFENLLFGSLEEYKVIKVLLEAPHSVLKSRVENRVEKAGVYMGKVEELDAEVAKEVMSEEYEKAYDLAIDTSRYTPSEISEMAVWHVNLKI